MLTKHDTALASAAVLRFSDVAAPVRFQFPPKVVSDGRKGSWEERDAQGVEPIAIYKGSGSRTISLQITYIHDGDTWNCSTIRAQVNKIRGYFQRVKKAYQERNLGVYLKLWCIGGSEELSFRMRSCDVKYSETMIMDGGTDSAWPLRTDITLDLASWTKDGTQFMAVLSPTMPVDWY